MWDDLNIEVASGQPLIIVRTREQIQRIHAQILEICEAQDPPRQLLHYTPPSGLVEYNVKEEQWDVLLPPGSTVGQVSEYLRQQYHLPCIVHFESPELWWEGNAVWVVRSLAGAFRDQIKTMVATVPYGTEIPPQYEGWATLLDHQPPTKEEVELLVSDTFDQNPWLLRVLEPILQAEYQPKVVTAIRGLTEGFAEAALTQAIARAAQKLTKAQLEGRTFWEFLLKAIHEWKSRQATAAGRIVLMDTSGYHDVAGWDAFKREVQALVEAGAFEIGNPLFPGMFVFLGLPGGGKSYVVGLMGRWTGLPVYDTRVSEMMGSGVVGSLERSFEATFQDARMVAPCILRIDELEKVIGGAQSSNRSDSGALNRGSQILLKFAQEDAARFGVVLAATMNSTDVRPEDIRLGRSFGIWFVDLPELVTREQAATIFMQDWLARQNAWLATKGKEPVKVVGVTPAWIAGLTEGWMPAEIELLLQKALVLGRSRELTKETVLAALETLVPMSVSMPEKLEALRQFGARIPEVGRGVRRGDVQDGKVAPTATPSTRRKQKVIPPPPVSDEGTTGQQVSQRRRKPDVDVHIEDS